MKEKITRLLENNTIKTVVLLLKFIRIRNCLIVSSGILLGAILGYPGEDILTLTAPIYLAIAAGFLITAGGNTLNDYFDYEIDKVNRPDRPIPSGRISRSDAMMLSSVLFLVGLGISKSINQYALAFAAANTAVLIMYAKYSKRLLLVSNLAISYLVATVFFFGATPHLTSPIAAGILTMKAVIVLSGCAFFMTLCREILKDIEDIEGDRRLYSNTLPIKLGPKKARRIAAIFCLTAVLLSITPILFRFPDLDLTVYGILIAVSDLTFIAATTMFAPLAQRAIVFGMMVSLAAFFTANILTKIQ